METRRKRKNVWSIRPHTRVPNCGDKGIQKRKVTRVRDEGRAMPLAPVPERWYPWRFHVAFAFRRRKPLVLDGSFVGRGVIVRLRLGWLGGRISRKAQERTRHMYNYRVVL